MPVFRSSKRIYVDGDGNIVPEDSEKVHKLLVAEGGELPMAVAEHYGLSEGEANAQTDAERRTEDAALLSLPGGDLRAAVRNMSPAQRAALIAESFSEEELADMLREKREREQPANVAAQSPGRAAETQSRAKTGPNRTQARAAPSEKDEAKAPGE